jgi:DNA-binding XRE family transcriptional regulator
MDHEHLISRIEIAAELGVQPQTIAHWERAGWFPRPKRKLSLKHLVRSRRSDHGARRAGDAERGAASRG